MQKEDKIEFYNLQEYTYSSFKWTKPLVLAKAVWKLKVSDLIFCYFKIRNLYLQNEIHRSLPLNHQIKVFCISFLLFFNHFQSLWWMYVHKIQAGWKPDTGSFWKHNVGLGVMIVQVDTGGLEIFTAHTYLLTR